MSSWATLLFSLAAFAVCLRSGSSLGVFEVQLSNWTNPLGVDDQGQSSPCVASSHEEENKTECRTFFRVCVTHVPRFLTYFGAFRRRLDPNAPCSFGLLFTDANRTTPAQVATNFTFDFAWPGRFFLIIEAWHTNGTQMPSEGSRLVMRLAEERKLKVPDGWAHKNYKSDHRHQLSYSFRVICAKGFTGSDCLEKCPTVANASNPFNCSSTGVKLCNVGWTGQDCSTATCREGCNEQHGYCELPGECRCRLGWSGEKCQECVPMPGCQFGSCNRTFECNCRNGWDGFFCSSPVCKPGCHPKKGYCESPGDCQCRYGWQGPLCESCRPLPGCVHGYCHKPLDCVCEDGWMGIFCSVPICRKDCDREHGYCSKPNECRCRVGWHGTNCSQCFPYPGCQNGDCVKPWECNCRSGWTGALCDTKLEMCGGTPCLYGTKCVDGACICPPEGVCGRESPEERD